MPAGACFVLKVGATASRRVSRGGVAGLKSARALVWRCCFRKEAKSRPSWVGFPARMQPAPRAGRLPLTLNRPSTISGLSSSPLRLMLNMTVLEPFVAQHAGRFAVVEPLRPGGVMIVDVLERQRPFSLQNHPGPRPVEPAAEFAGPLVHRVEKDAVGLDSGDQFGQHLQIVLWLPARPGVPRVVVNEDFHVAAVASAAEVAQAVQAARHVAVEIELVAIVHANPRIGVPQDEAVV